MKFQVEHTDTFGGESNYSWVHRYTIEGKGDKGITSDLSLVRQAKRLTGLTGYRCRVTKYGDMIEIRPSGLCQVVFITWG